MLARLSVWSKVRIICVWWIRIPLGMEVGCGPSDIVLDGDPGPPPMEMGTAFPHFLAHVCCGQLAGWIRITLGTEVGFGPGGIVLPSSPHGKGHSSPLCFGTVAYCSNCWALVFITSATFGRVLFCSPFVCPFLSMIIKKTYKCIFMKVWE